MKNNLKEHIKQIIRESLADNDKEKGRVGLTLLKFPVLKEALVKLLSKSFMYFIKDIKVVAPKPTIFEIKLVNHLDFSLQYIFKAKNWIAKISGKKYNLSILSDGQRAMNAIANLLTLSPSLQETNPADGNEGESFQNDPGQTAFNDAFSGGASGGFDEPIAPSSEISPDTEPLSLNNPDSQGNEQDNDVQPEEIAEGKKKIKLKEFLSKISELEINKPKTNNISLGKFKSINKSTQGNIKTFTWDETLKQNILSTITKRNAIKLFEEILGIKPERVKVEYSGKARNSYYIYGKYKSEPIILARRESEHPMAGQTIVYSKYAKIPLHDILGKTDYSQKRKDMEDKYGERYYTQDYGKLNKEFPNSNYFTNNSKENVLKTLKIEL